MELRADSGDSFDLSATLALLRAYDLTPEERRRNMQEYAKAEASLEDPIQAERISPAELQALKEELAGERLVVDDLPDAETENHE